VARFDALLDAVQHAPEDETDKRVQQAPVAAAAAPRLLVRRNSR
jgi:hypothetical protein